MGFFANVSAASPPAVYFAKNPTNLPPSPDQNECHEVNCISKCHSGVTHYSDAPPEESGTSLIQLEINTGKRSSSAASGSSDHYYSIANQWQRIQKERLQQQQLELQKAALTVTRTIDRARTDYYNGEDTTRYVTVYPAKLHRRHDYRKRYPRYHSGYAHTRQSNPQPASLGSFPTTN